MEAEAEEAAADLGPELGMLPVTPDIGWKPARPSQTGTDGSSCSALFDPAAPASIGLGKVESDGFGYAPSSIGEQCQSVPGKMGEEDCAAGAQASNASPQESGSSDKISPQEGTAANATSASATPIPTPEKVEHTPWRPRKRSTKGVPRFKVMKDKTVKVKATPKATTLHVVQKKRKTKKDGGEPVGASSAKSARRKLDFESSESVSGSFSRAKLMDNLRCLAKIHGLSDDSSAGMRGKKGKKRKTMIVKHQDSGELAIVPYQKAPTDASSSALVPGGNFMPLAIVRHGSHWKKLRTKVLGLDEKTLQVYDVLRKWDETDSESFEGVDIGSGPEWDETRQYFEQCVDVFISTMDDLLGPRKFSQWGGSVIDSVVGTFLTQNVADNLSSNAFMNLAAKFPPTKRCSNGEECTNAPPLRNIGKENLDFNEASDVTDSVNSVFTKPVDSDNDIDYNEEVKGHYGQDYKTIIENFIASMKQKDISTWDNEHLMNLVKDKFGNPVCTDITLRKFIATLQLKDTSHWDKLREEAYRKGYNNRSETGISDSVNWGAVLHAPTVDVAKCIAVRGQHYIMACRIQAFLMRVKKDHGSFDLDWLQYVPRESAKNYLLSIHGLGDKSVDCIRLLSLKHKAFPVDVNVARIVTRLGWVKLQPLPFSAEFHSVDLYPIMRDVQRYLWPRLCKIHKGKLYELHCLMITFGKAICTKVNPNCSACPFSAKCKYYNSSLNREALPPAEEHEHERGKEQTSMVTSGRLLSNGSDISSFQQVGQRQVEISWPAERQSIHNCEPIIEVPPSPEYQYEEARNEQEEPYQDDPCDLEDIVPEGVQYDAEIDLCSNKHMLHSGSWTPSCGKDLVLINLQRAFCQNKKLKNIGRLRTEHNAYVLPDDHAILEEFEERISEDPCPYLLVVISCPDEHTVKGTILIPCRTATRGNFPLNGTYFQDHEVFADYSSSRSPITIPRECIWNLERCIVYFGSSIHSITKGQTKQDIQDCYKKGYICVRGFDRHTRYPKRLCATLHATNEKKENGENSRKKAKTSPQGKNDEKASSAN